MNYVVDVQWTNQANEPMTYSSEPIDRDTASILAAEYRALGHDVDVRPTLSNKPSCATRRSEQGIHA